MKDKMRKKEEPEGSMKMIAWLFVAAFGVYFIAALAVFGKL